MVALGRGQILVVMRPDRGRTGMRLDPDRDKTDSQPRRRNPNKRDLVGDPLGLRIGI